MPLVTLRGHGPAPRGYYVCRDPKCPARREPWSCRFARLGTHYHPITAGAYVPQFLRAPRPDR